MRNDLLRIDPEDAEEFDTETDTLLRLWAARKLDVADGEIARVLVEVTGGCGEGTCEMTDARAEVDLTDGRVFLSHEESFGLFIRDIVSMDVNSDGTERRSMWTLYDEDGKNATPPKPKPAPKPYVPPPPALGTVRRRPPTTAAERLMGTESEVYTKGGWVSLLDVVAAYDERNAPTAT